MNKKLMIPFFVTMVGFLITIAAFFLPYYTITDKQAAIDVILDELGDYYYYEVDPDELNEYINNYSNISIPKLISMLSDSDSGIAATDVASVVRNIIIYGFFIVSAIINTVRGKFKGAIGGSVCMLAMYVLMLINFGAAGDPYVFGAGFVLSWVGIAITLLGNIWRFFAASSINNTASTY